MADLYSRTNEAILEELGRRLARTRLNRNLPQAELAENAGVSLRTVQNAEAGQSCSLETFIRLLRALGELEGLAAWLPDRGPSPIDLADRQGKERRRASGKRTDEPDEEWSW
jgi:transcriptional regulator with XRE-family HTH domain